METNNNTNSENDIFNPGGMKIDQGKAPESSKKEDIVLDIGEISELSPGRAKNAAQNITGNLLIDTYHKINNAFINLGRVKAKDKMIFYQLLGTMIGSGISLIKALNVLSSQITNKRLAKVVWEISNEIEKGSSFSDALLRFPGIFDDSEVGMIASGEAGGRLHEVLEQLAIQFEKINTIYGRVKGAMIYPLFILVVMAAAISAIMIIVVPKLTEVFAQSQKELPKVTQYLLFTSDFMKAYWLPFMIFAIIAGILFYSWIKTETGKYKWDNLKLKLPILGLLNMNIALARMNRSLSSLLQSGVPIIKALEIDADAVGNELYREKLRASAEDVGKGIPLGESLSANEHIFPPMVVYMLTVGEKTAQIGEMAGKVAEYYEEEIDNTTRNLVKFIEPLIIATLALVVGVLVIAIMMPILQMSDLAMTG